MAPASLRWAVAWPPSTEAWAKDAKQASFWEAPSDMLAAPSSISRSDSSTGVMAEVGAAWCGDVGVTAAAVGWPAGTEGLRERLRGSRARANACGSCSGMPPGPPVDAAGTHVCSAAAMRVSSGAAGSMGPSGIMKWELIPARRDASAASAASASSWRFLQRCSCSSHTASACSKARRASVQRARAAST